MPNPNAQPTADDLDYLTPEEISALQSTPSADNAGAAEEAAEQSAAAQADEEGAAADAAETTLKAEEAPAADNATEGDQVDAQALQRVLDDAEPAQAQQNVQTYDGIGKDAFTAERAKLNEEKATALKQLMDGEIDAAAYSAIDSRVSDQIAELTSAYTLGEATRQSTQRAVQDSIKSLMDRSKGQALDYWADSKAQKQFDQALQLLSSDPDNAGRPVHELVADADRTVRALRGISAAPAPSPTAAAPKAAPAPAVKRDVPPGIARMPAAAPNNVGQDLRDKLATLEGDDAEEFIASLSPAQQKALAQGVAV